LYRLLRSISLSLLNNIVNNIPSITGWSINCGSQNMPPGIKRRVQEFLDNTWYLISKVYCHIHQQIDITYVLFV